MINPVYVIVTLLKLSSYAAVPVFAATLLLIDKRDEFQVVNFILSFKIYRASARDSNRRGPRQDRG